MKHVKNVRRLVIVGDVRSVLANMPDECVDVVLTSPPYWGLRNYGNEKKQIGQEPTWSEYITQMVHIFKQVRRVLRREGVLFLNMGDIWWSKSLCRSKPIEAMYGNRKLGSIADRSNIDKNNQRGALSKDQSPVKPKDLCGIPWRLALALQEDGWYLRQDIIWHKPNPQPERKLDRFTKAHEYVFMLTKSYNYSFDPNRAFEVTTQGATRQQRSVITIPTKRFKDDHFATMPLELAQKLIHPVTFKRSVVLDIFSGHGTTGLATPASAHYIGIELHKPYAQRQLEKLGPKAELIQFERKGRRKKQLKSLITSLSVNNTKTT